MVLEKSDTTLLMEQLVVSSDDDLEIWAGITVGYDDDKNFVIELAFEDYEDNSRNKVTRAVLDKHNTCLLCDRLGTSILKTTKANGLGLGVNIVRTMAENYVGRLTYHQLKPSGIMAEVTIPAVAPEPTNTPEESQHG